MLRIKRSTLAGLMLPILVFSLIFVPIIPVFGTTSTTFPAKYYGYIGDTHSTSGDYVIKDPYTDGCGDSFPMYIDTKAELINFIEALYYGSNYWVGGSGCKSKNYGSQPITYPEHNKIGAGFIIQTMLSDGVTYDRTLPTDAEVTAWESKVTNYQGTIGWAVPKNDVVNSSSQNTYSDGSDVRWYNSSGSSSASGVIVFYDSGGNIDYMIKRNCGNPIGTMDGIKEATKYDLDPHVSLGSSGIVESGSGVNMSPYISNNGSASSGSSTNWKFTYFEVKSGGTVPHLSETDTTKYNSTETNPCKFYTGTTNCGSAVFAATTTSPYTGAASTVLLDVPTTGYIFQGGRYANIGDLSAGTKVCYALSVQPRATDSTEWRYSKPECVTIGTKPKVQIWGSDLVVGKAGSSLLSSIQTNTSDKYVSGAKITFGSWVEYGARANGNIKTGTTSIGIGSGSAYARGLANATDCKAGMLVFTNGGNSTCDQSGGKFGNYSSMQQVLDIGASFKNPTNVIPAGAVNNLSNLNGVYSTSGDIDIKGGTINVGNWVVINAPTANVSITGDIAYFSGRINSIERIPQLVIIAKNINISVAVKQIDAWLVAQGSGADGYINTCSDAGLTGSLNISICNQTLQVNGPVIANKLYLRRTAGSFDNPAEIFNLRPDAYMWAYAQSVGDNRAQTVYSVESPPRL